MSQKLEQDLLKKPPFIWVRAPILNSRARRVCFTGPVVEFLISWIWEVCLGIWIKIYTRIYLYIYILMIRIVQKWEESELKQLIYMRPFEIEPMQVRDIHCYCVAGTSTLKDSWVFVVKSFENVPSLIKWHAALCGGLICEPTVVTQGSGICHTFQAALESVRLLWMTDSFVRAHPTIADATVHRTSQTFLTSQGLRLISYTYMVSTYTYIP